MQSTQQCQFFNATTKSLLASTYVMSEILLKFKFSSSNEVSWLIPSTSRIKLCERNRHSTLQNSSSENFCVLLLSKTSMIWSRNITVLTSAAVSTIADFRIISRVTRTPFVGVGRSSYSRRSSISAVSFASISSNTFNLSLIRDSSNFVVVAAV